MTATYTTDALTALTIPALRAIATTLQLTIPAKAKKDDIVSAIMDATTPAADDATPDVPADLFADGDTYGAADIAAALDMDAYDLRVILRTLGYGVGKGSKYSFDAGDATNVYRAVRHHLATTVVDDTTTA
jgi:hypothetical protein